MNLPTNKDIDLYSAEQEIKNLRYQRKCAVWALIIMSLWTVFNLSLIERLLKHDRQKLEDLRQLDRYLQAERALRQGTPSDIAIDKP